MEDLRWVSFDLKEEELTRYSQALSIEDPQQAVEGLSRAIGISPVWANLPPAVLLLRRSSNPGIALLGEFRSQHKAILEALLRDLRDACTHLRYIHYPEAERQCRHLASLLIERFGRDRLARAGFWAIPRGGTTVLGMLAQVLDLAPEQLSQTTSSRELVVVDDCALTGSRFREFLQESDARSVIFAHLYSHPSLRSSIEEQEPKVVACISSGDLAVRELHSEEGEENRRRRWEQRLGGKRYWIGSLEHICFPWTEPDRVVWNPAEGKTELAWRVVPPELCLKNRRRGDAPTAEVQVLSEGQGSWSLGPEVFYARLGPYTLVANLATDDSVRLEGAARDMWHLLLDQGNLQTITPVLVNRYEIDQDVLEPDLGRFLDQVLLRGFLEQAL